MGKVESNGKTLPEKRFSTGAISATVWKNNGTNKKTGGAVEYRTVSLQRRYLDPSGVWQTSSSLRINDLPRAALVLQKSYEYLVLKGQDSSISEEAMEEEEIVM